MTTNPEEAFFLEQKGRNWKSISIELKPEYNRKPFPSDPNDENIEKLWKEKREKNPDMKLFNAMKFRLHSSSSTDSTLTLQLGISDYKSLVGTNFRPFFDKKTEEYTSATQKQEDPYLAHCLGVAACVVSADNVAVMFKRSKHVAQHAGFAAFPGGHAEPYRFFRRLGELEKGTPKIEKKYEALTSNPILSDEKIDEHVPVMELRRVFDSAVEVLVKCGEEKQEQTIEKALVDELFFSIKEEVHGELGVPLELVEVESVLGLIRATSVTTKGKPDLCFKIKINCSFQDIKTKYFTNRTGEDAFEAEEGSLIGMKLELPPPHNDDEKNNKNEGKKQLLESFKDKVQLTAPCLASLVLAIEAM